MLGEQRGAGSAGSQPSGPQQLLAEPSASLRGPTYCNGHPARRSGLSWLARLTLIPLVFLLGPRLASATIFVVSDKAPLVSRADAIALGTVRAVTPRWEGRRIVSDVALDVEQTIKGSLPQQLSVVAPGGKIGDVVMRVIDGADFHVGDRSIVFLSRRDGTHRLLGLAAGKLDVHTRAGIDVVVWPKGDLVEEVPLARVVGELRTLATEVGK